MRLPRGMVCLLAVVGVLAPAQRSWAQTVTTPGEALLEILSGGVVFQGEVVITAIAAPALTFPISSSASGFTFYFDSQLQQVVPASNSFGSLFSERALTNGRGRFSFSGNYQRKRWRSIDGFDLDGGLQFVAKWQLDHPSLLDGYPMRPGDTENFIATLHFDTDVMVLAANYGVSDRLDVGVAAPIMRTDISGSHRVTRTLVSGEEMTVTAPVHVASSATGLGDLFVRAKYNVFRNNTLSLAGVGEVRLPTGSTENLHGVGVTVPKGTVVASFRYDRLAPHVNVAYARGDGGIPFRNFDAGLNAFRPGCPPPAEDPSCRTPSLEDRYLALTDEVTYSVGAELEASARLTVSADVVGRYLRNGAKFSTISKPGVRAASGLPISRDTVLFAQPADIHSVVTVVGGKFRIAPTRKWLAMVNVIVPQNDAGLRSGVAWSIGLDRAF